MGIGMARQDREGGMRITASIAALLAALTLGGGPSALGQVIPEFTPLPKACEIPGRSVFAALPLPNIAIALKERKKINILAIGATSASLRGPLSGGYYAVVERFLEATFKGLDVEIVHRGISGELASDAADRIKTEVALNNIDLVLWQVGTADALAQVPVEDFQAGVGQAVDWLREHKIDIILVGLRYTRSMTRNKHYQAIREAIHRVAKDHNILRIGRYEAEETLEKIRLQQVTPPSALASSD